MTQLGVVSLANGLDAPNGDRTTSLIQNWRLQGPLPGVWDGEPAIGLASALN